MKLLISCLCIIIPLTVYANRPGVYTDADGNVVRGTPSTTSDLGDTGGGLNDSGSSTPDDDTNLTNYNGFDNATSGAESNARSSEGSSNLTKILGMAMGAAFMSQCGPKNPAACAMAAMSFADALASGKNQGNSTNFGNSLLPYGGTDGNGGDSTGDDSSSDPTVQEAQAQLTALEGMGYSLNADGSVNTPEGQNLTTDDLSSAATLQAKGFSPGDAASAMDMLNSTRDKAMKDAGIGGGAGRAIASTGGDGGVASGGGSTNLSDIIIDEGPAGGNAVGAGKKKMSAEEAANLSKNFKGTPIGISMADIFLIVKKKYEQKNAQQTFINKEY